MRHDREREPSNRNNWLLIKHRDGYERESDVHPVIDHDRSVASGRSMEGIARGQRPAADCEARSRHFGRAADRSDLRVMPWHDADIRATGFDCGAP